MPKKKAPRRKAFFTGSRCPGYARLRLATAPINASPTPNISAIDGSGTGAAEPVTKVVTSKLAPAACVNTMLVMGKVEVKPMNFVVFVVPGNDSPEATKAPLFTEAENALLAPL